MDRRTFLGATAALAALPRLGNAGTASGGRISEADQQKADLKELLANRARETRLRIEFDGNLFSGPGWDRLVDEGRKSHFFLLGEEHGVAQMPVLARELVLILARAGYERMALEISAPVAAELDRAALGGVEGIRKFNAEFPPGPAFYMYKEEAEFVAKARPALPRDRQAIWGLDYEVIQDRRLIARLVAAAPPQAKAAVRALDESSQSLWQKFHETHNPQFIFSFAGDPKLVAAVRSAWPHPTEAIRVILDTLEGTLETNALWVAQRGWESNDRRTHLMRGAFVRYWQYEKAKGRTPKVFFKLGASHMVRGRDMSEVFDIGDLVANTAALEGHRSYHVFACPPRTGMTGQFNPSDMSLMPAPATSFDEQGVGFLADVGYPDAYTLLDMRELRPILGYKTAAFDVKATRVIHGFDAMVVMPGTTPSKML
jgi:hypothetical protein